MKRYFKKKEHHLIWVFWEVTVLGPSITERFGTHGTRGESKSRIYPSNDTALHIAQRSVDSKQAEGFQEVIPVPSVGPWYGVMDAETEERFLASLEKVAKGPPTHVFFNAPAPASSIAALEAECRIVLPSSLRSFLSYYDGGFIWRKGSQQEFERAQKAFPEEDETSLQRSVSFRLLSVQEIRDVYNHKSAYSWGPGIVPFCEIYNGEVLTVWSMRHSYQESPVFDAFHEEEPSAWRQLYPTFAHLFSDYVERQGAIKT